MFQKITQIVEKQVNILMIPKEEGWHYIVRKIPAL